MIFLKVTTAKKVRFARIVFLINQGLKFQGSVPNVCHDFTMLSVNVNDFVIITVKNNDYRCVIHKIIRSEATHLLQNSMLEDRRCI